MWIFFEKWIRIKSIIYDSIRDKREKIEDKDKKSINFFLLQNEGSEFNIEDVIRLIDNSEAFMNFLLYKKVIFLGRIKSGNKEVKYKKIIEKIIKEIKDKKSEDKNQEDKNPEDKKKKKVKILGIFGFKYYSNNKKDSDIYGW